LFLGYAAAMFCPNDNALMYQTVVPTHYGQKIVIDQCEVCGGLWFDAFELFKTNPSADEIFAELDIDDLREPTDIDNSSLLCPRDRTELCRYDDRRFPAEIVLMRCQACQGFWLNRGGFGKYQLARQSLMAKKGKPDRDEVLDKRVNQLLASHRAGSNSDVLGRAGAFLSAPVGAGTVFPLNSDRESNDHDSTFNLYLDVLIAILRIFVFRV
jgi:Zn-finger nucleic acid-binding protein